MWNETNEEIIMKTDKAITFPVLYENKNAKKMSSIFYYHYVLYHH